jgi:hypothetical protein
MAKKVRGELDRIREVLHAEADAAFEETPPEPTFLPELWGYGVEKGAGGWLAYRLSNTGTVDILNPRRNGKIAGEQKATALARINAAMKAAYLGPQKRSA